MVRKEKNTMAAKKSIAERLKASATRVREEAKQNQAELTEEGAGLASAYVFGNLQKTPRQFAMLPNVAGVGRMATLGVASLVLQRFAPSGMAHDVVRGIGRTARSVAVFQFAANQDPDVAADAYRAAHEPPAAPAPSLPAAQGVGRFGQGAARNLEKQIQRRRLKQKLEAVRNRADIDDDSED